MKRKTQAWIIPLTALSLVLSVFLIFFLVQSAKEPQDIKVLHPLQTRENPFLQALDHENQKVEQWIQNKDFKKAHAFLEKKQAEEPENLNWRYLSSALIAREKTPSEALQWLEGNLDFNEKTHLELYAWMAWSLGEWPKAVEKKSLSKSDHGQALEKALQALWDKKVEESLKLIKNVPKGPSYFETFVADMKEIEKEIAGIQGEKESYSMAKVLQSLNHHGATRMSLVLGPVFLEKYPDYRDLWTLTGQASMLQASWDTAIAQLTESLKIDATDPIPSYYLGLAFVQKGIYDKAIEALEMALLYGFEDTTAIYPEIAKSYYHLGRHDEALKSFEYVLQQKSESAKDFHLALWLALEKIQSLARAEKLVNLCMKRHPQEALSYQFQAIIALEKKDETSASKWIQKALKIDPELAEAHVSAGLLLEMQKQKESAKWEYEKALEFAEPGSFAEQEARSRLDALNNESPSP